ncbi:MAG: HAD family hydrolase [Vicinamibacterales bacterium]
MAPRPSAAAGFTPSGALGVLAGLRALLFDLDGVVTRTATVHAAAWKQLFDEYLQARAGPNAPFRPFDILDDYRRYVDGKPRYDGVASFLESRGMRLPWGSPADDASEETVCGLGNRKDRYFEERVQRFGVDVFADAAHLLGAAKRHRLPTAVVSSSKNCEMVLRAARLDCMFDARVDGVESDRLRLAGKPAPDTFLEAARRLGVRPAEAIVFEDAIAGVEAARRGGFRVVGVDRIGQAQALKDAGADVVSADLDEFAGVLGGFSE